MRKALYLRPDAIVGTPFDEAVKAWLREEDVEPLDEGEHELVAFLPYDGGGCYYHQEVSPSMALVISAAMATGRAVEGIKIRETDTKAIIDGENQRRREVLTEVSLEWVDGCYRNRVTIGVITPEQVLEKEEAIRRDAQISWHDIGHDWRPLRWRAA